MTSRKRSRADDPLDPAGFQLSESSTFEHFRAAYQRAQAALQAAQAEVQRCSKQLHCTRCDTTEWSDVIHLNVGGVHYTVRLETLRQEKNSFLYHLFTSSPQRALPKDHTGRLYLDRNGNTFRYILSYLRGYRGLRVPPELVPLLREDMEYYGLSGMRQKVPSLREDKTWLLNPGVGVQSDESKLGGVLYDFSGYAVVLCQGPWLSGRNDRFTISFRCDRSDGVGIGIVSAEYSEFTQEMAQSRNCAVYTCTGAVYTNFTSIVRDPVLGAKIQPGDIITVHLDCIAQHVEWIRNDESIRVVPLPRGEVPGRWKFALQVRAQSRVQIIHGV